MTKLLQAVWAFCLAALVGVAPANAATGIALLIGNSKYEAAVGPLETPGQDINLVRQSLIDVGLNPSDIRVVTNASRIEMLTAIDEFARKSKHLNNDQIAFFYYAGHGAKNPKSASGLHLIPTSAKSTESNSFWYETVNFSKDVVQSFKNAQSRAAWIVAIDACRNELHLPSRNMGGGDRGFGAVPSSSGMLISFAADDNQTAKDKIDGSSNSPYAMALAKHIRKPGQTISSVFGAIRPEVMERTSYVQEPVYTNKLNIDPILVRTVLPPKPTPTPTPTPKPKPTPKPRPFSLVEQLQQDLADLGPDVRQAIAAYDNGSKLFDIGRRKKSANGGKYDRTVARIYDAACRLGSASGCTDLGFMYGAGQGGVNKDKAQAALLYRKGCDGGNALGCRNLGYYYQYAYGGLSKDYGQAVGLYRKACDGNDLGGCTNLGYMYRMGYGTSKNDRLAVQYYRKACDGNRALGCNNLGNMYEKGLGGLSANKTEAIRLYKKALSVDPNLAVAKKNLENIQGSNVTPPPKPMTDLEKVRRDLAYLGSTVTNAVNANDKGASLYRLALKRDPTAGGTDGPNAVKMYQGACTLQNGSACTNLGYLYERGMAGLSKNDYSAVTYYRKGCNLSNGTGCKNLGVLYRAGRGGLSKSDVTAVSMYRKSCNLNDGGGCTNLGFMYERGYGGLSKDLSSAVNFYRTGCTKGDGTGCANLGYMYRNGLGGLSKNDYLAVENYRKGCDKKVGRGCTNLGYMYRMGYGVTKNATTAVDLYRKGCSYGSPMGCNNLGNMYENGSGGLSKSRTSAIRYYREALKHNPSLSVAKTNLQRLGVSY